MKQRKGVLMDIETGGGGEHQICSFMWADNFCIMSHSKKHLEQMPASLWWTNTHVKDWWITCALSSPLEVKLGRGHSRQGGRPTY